MIQPGDICVLKLEKCTDPDPNIIYGEKENKNEVKMSLDAVGSAPCLIYLM